MSFSRGPKIVTDGLVLALDAANTKSYSGTGTSWNDLSGNGNNGTLINGPTFNSDNNGSIVFDGVDDYVQTNLNTHYSQITLSTWARRNDTNSFRSLIGKYRGDPPQTESYELLFNNSAGIRFHVTTSPIDYNISTTTGVWYNVVGTYNGTTAKLYLNGTEVSSGNRTAGINSVNFRIGASPRGANYNNGNISQVSIHNRALTAEEILQNYNSTKSRYGL
jgi:hypothetical protein